LILYCDTSALIKLYLKEEFSDAVNALANSATAIAVCRITWTEAMAGFARRSRENPADAEMIEASRKRLRNDWQGFMVVEVTQDLMELAGDYADTFALRAYDSVQLAAARTLQKEVSIELHFACFDMRLQKAAKVLGLETHGGN
jgi:predicted nucleic acid-binding protein